jgi:hypothetical protein
MVVWRGWGILVILLVVACMIGTQLVVNAILGDSTYQGWMIGGALLLAAVPVWFIGRRLNGRPGRTLVDQAMGQQVTLRAKHDLFFVKMEYWAPLLAVGGVLLLLLGDR